jgi:tRNA A-37 threonylcarbamoyl transferase component Bud32
VDEEKKRCPFCGEQILAVAIKCKHCGERLDGRSTDGTGHGVGANAPVVTHEGGAAMFPPGTTIREYRIEKLLGAGGMGEVYLARDVNTGREVAMKVVIPELLRDEGVRRRFVEEARVMAALSHPNIVGLYAFFEEARRYFLVMEYIHGVSLDKLLAERQLPVNEAVRIAGGVLAALQYAHSRPQPVIHRDIKPANVLLAKDGRVVVMDFGIAKALGRERLTRTRGVVGTYEYMSPEQVGGEDVGPASDIYSVGVTLYQMLTGVVPFPQRTETGIDVMQGHLQQPVPPLAKYREGLPRWMEDAVVRALAKVPAQRFRTAEEMARALERLMAPGAGAEAKPGRDGVSSEASRPPTPTGEATAAGTGGAAAVASSTTTLGRRAGELGRLGALGIAAALLVVAGFLTIVFFGVSLSAGKPLAVLAWVAVAIALAFGIREVRRKRPTRALGLTLIAPLAAIIVSGVLGVFDSASKPSGEPASKSPSASTPQVVPCDPGCEGRICGPDRCGGTCGECQAPHQVCRNGQCVQEQPTGVDRPSDSPSGSASSGSGEGAGSGPAPEQAASDAGAGSRISLGNSIEPAAVAERSAGDRHSPTGLTDRAAGGGGAAHDAEQRPRNQTQDAGEQKRAEAAAALLLVQEWARAQTNEDFKAYAGFYSPDFVGIKRTRTGGTNAFDRQQWLDDRRKMFETDMTVLVDSVISTHFPDGERMQVRFMQYWKNKKYADKGDKVLELAREGSDWKIRREEMLNSSSWDGVLP